MKGVVESRWFALADLAAVSIGIFLWELVPELSWQPLLIALAPWVLRILVGKAPFKRTKFDLLLVVFLSTAAMGVWAAYDRDTAWTKFWLLLGGVLLYYAVANVPQENLWIVAGLAGILAAGISIYFVLTLDYQNQSADFQIIDRLGQWWISHRPVFASPAPPANMIGGTLAMLLPYPLALCILAWQKRQAAVLIFGSVISSLAFFGLFLTSSRAAWAALAIALSCWWLWELTGWTTRYSSKFSKSKVLNQRSIFAVTLLAIGALAIIVLSNSTSGIDSLFNSLPGASDGDSRLELYRNSLSLVQDFIYTGGGLGSFAGLYSRYILVIPHFFYGYSHNLFLDLMIEQGIFGFGIFLLIFIASVWITFEQVNKSVFHWAILASLIVIGFHGLLDDALYGGQGTALLLLSIGLGLAATQSPVSNHTPFSLLSKRALQSRRSLAAVAIITLVFILINWKPLLSLWYSNLGSLEMARVELVDFPTGRWEDVGIVPLLLPAERLFGHALQYDAKNPTANYRLGMIYLLRRDFPRAIQYLETSSYLENHPRGLQKNLGYSYVWEGQFKQALYILRDIPETRNEMDAYAWMWRTEGKVNLASNALAMAEVLNSQGDSTSNAGNLNNP